ncbi:unnamed protein product [Staurois parvus]|uniref:Uncharacterized protein n=1 Tax=Staurois parvus TaxID=386267 RepID=A0ABN9CNE6_9NEOB|nr:unnamed protein product [Staurois parvus]
MSCQSAPDKKYINLATDKTEPWRCLWLNSPAGAVSRGPHEMPLVPFSYSFFSLGKDTGAP